MEKRTCPKCKGLLESDNFCVNCMEFARFEESDSYEQSNSQEQFESQEQNKVNKENQYYDKSRESNIHNNQVNKNSVNKGKTPMKSYLIAFASMVGIIILGVFAIKALENNKVIASMEKAFVLEDSESDDSYMYSDDSTEYAYEESNTTQSGDGYTITEVDYDDIIAEGEPSTYYYLYDIMADDMVAELNDYIYSVETSEITYDDQYSDNYLVTYDDGSEYTCYETYNVWNYKDDSDDIFYLMKDTVTGNLMSVGVESKDFNRAAGLMIKAIEMLEGSLTSEEETYVTEQLNMSHKEEEVSFVFKNQLIYGVEEDGYISFDMYLNNYIN